MTPEGHRKLKERLQRLREVERPKIVLAIEEARSHGDLSENAEYDAAKEAQQHLVREMQEIEHKLSLAHIIDPIMIKSEKIAFGATVTVCDEDGKKFTYKIVGEDEADISSGMVSVLSPIARAMIGKEEGDEASYKTPKGERVLEIVQIEYK